MKVSRTALLTAVVAPLLLTQLGGCTTNPATGKSVFTAGMSQEDEIRIGRENHPKIIKEFGGEYGTSDLKRYIDDLGQRLAAKSDRPDLKFTFTVLNSDIINAFALPGGYIYVTRGLITLAGSEAELSGVIAHEIGHVTALHHARREGSTLLTRVGLLAANIGLAVGGVPGGRTISQLGDTLAIGVLRGFSREDEYEADMLGVRYLARTGYDPGAMAGFLIKLREHSRLEATRRGDPPGHIDQFNYLATHPPTTARARRARALARRAKVTNPVTARDAFFAKIDGITYGGDPDQGFVRGRDFLHPKLRFAFRAPPGYSLFNSPEAVVALGPSGGRILFDQAQKPVQGTLTRYISREWAPRLRHGKVEAIKVNGLDAATTTARVRTRGGEMELRLVAYRMKNNVVYRFLMLSPTGRSAANAAGLRKTMYSFRVLSAAEAGKLKPHRLRIITVRRGDTVASLARRMPHNDYKVERFEVLNGIKRTDRLVPGRKLKLIVEEKAR